MSHAATAAAPSSVPYHEGDTSLALATLVPFSSDGPTLPLVGSSSRPQPVGNSGTKRKSSSDADADADADANTATANHKKLKTTPADHSALSTPWTFLDDALKQRVQRQIRETGASQWTWDTHCVGVVYTRNQNIRTAVNRLKLYLGHERGSSGIEVPDVLKGDADGGGGVIAVSAMGEATTKLVGVVELAKRVVGSSSPHSSADKNEDDMQEDGAGAEDGGTRQTTAQTWYSYAVLSSRAIPASTPQDLDAATDDNTTRNASSSTTTPARARQSIAQGQDKPRKVPVLTVYLSRRSIDALRRGFGEQKFEVCSAAD